MHLFSQLIFLFKETIVSRKQKENKRQQKLSKAQATALTANIPLGLLVKHAMPLMQPLPRR